MGNDNSSSEHSPNKRSISPTNRKISPIKQTKNFAKSPTQIKNQNMKNKSKLSKILSNPKNIMHFISQCENTILLKNMNDSNSIGFNHLNILFNPDIINPCLESDLRYMQIIEDSVDKKILGKLKVQNKEFSQKQLESLTNNLIEINNDINYNNNYNLGNLSSIHKKKASKEESPASQKDDDFDLTSFSTTIGGKASHNISNTKSYGNNKTNNSKQVRTFKIKTKEGFTPGDTENNNYNYDNNRNYFINNQTYENNTNYKNNLLRRDSPYSIHSDNSSNNISNNNELSPINSNKSNKYFHSKNSSNNSFKEQNNSNKNNNAFNNNSNKTKHISCISDIKSFQTVNATKINKNTNIKNIPKKIIRKKLIAPEQIIGPKDNIKSPRKNTINLTNIDRTPIKEFLNNQDNISYIDNNLYINETISDINSKSPNQVLNKTNFFPNLNKRCKSPDIILSKKEESSSENSRIIFNNVRRINRHNYSNSNTNSSQLNNLTMLSSIGNRKTNVTNIINNDQLIKKYLDQNESSYLKTEVNKEKNSYMKGVINKKKIVKNKNSNPFKDENIDNKKNKLDNKYIQGVKKINKIINKPIKKGNINNENINSKVFKKEVKLNNKNKVANENLKINENKKIMKKININSNTERIINKTNLAKNPKYNLHQNKTDNKLILNPKKIETNKNINHNIIKNRINQNNIKTNNSFKKNKELSKKEVVLFDDNLENINFLDEEYEEPQPENTTIKKNNNNNINKELNNGNHFDKQKISYLKNNGENKSNAKVNISNINEIKKFNTYINNNEKQNKIANNQINQKKRNIKKPKINKKKNIVFNIDLSNDKNNDFSKSEDISDNSLSNEEKIDINNLNNKIKQPLKNKTYIINKKHINNKKNSFDNFGNNLKNDKEEKNLFDNKLNKINNAPKIRKETNIPNSNINRLIIEKYDNTSDNVEDLDDVCNFSGINNISYTKKQEKEKGGLFDKNFDDIYQREHSPQPIFHKKIKFDSKFKNINKTKENNLNKINKDKQKNNLNILQNEVDEFDITNDKINDNYNRDNYAKEKSNEIYENNLKEQNTKYINDDNDINEMNTNKISNNIYNSSQGYVSFKIKKNNNNNIDNKVNEKINEEKNDKINNKYKKNNESIIESIGSSKFSFKINDDIHESEFNDVEFLD